MPQRRVALHHRLRHGHGLVGRIVQQLDIELVLGIIDLADRLHQPVHHVLLVVNRELDGHARQLGKAAGRLVSPVLPVFVIHVNQDVAVNSVGRENDENGKVRN